MRREVLASCLLFAGTIALYAPVRDHEFVNYDDRIYIVENPNLGAGVEGVIRAFTAPYENNWIPLTWISLQMDHALFGRHPAGYHATNVLLHAASTVLLFWVLLRMFGPVAPLRSASATPAYRWRCFFIAGVFAVHPLHVESVAWAAERKDVLSGVFWMLTLHAYVSWVRKPSVARHLGVGAGLLLGLLAKPMGVTLPFVLLLLDYWPLGRLTGDGPRAWPDPARLRGAVLEKLPWFLLVAVFCIVTFAVQRATGAMAPDDALPLGIRIQNAAHAYAWYAVKSLWPSGLAVFYPHPLRSIPVWQTLALAAALVAATGAAVRAAPRRPYLLVGWLWYLGTLVPMIGLVQVGLQARADRYMYIPLIGLSLAVAWGALDLARAGSRGRAMLGGVAAASLAALVATSAAQIPHWRDTEALFRRALTVTHDNYVAHHGLASVLLLDSRSEEARVHYEEAARIKPRWPAAQLGLGEVLEEEGDLEGARVQYELAVRLGPRNARAYEKLGMVLLETHHPNRSVRRLTQALELAGESNQPRLHARLARALIVQGDLETGILNFRKAVELDPNLAEAHANLGFALIRADRSEQAEQSLMRAHALGLESAELEAGLGQVAMEGRRWDTAIAHLRAARALGSDSTTVANNLAWLLATNPSPAGRDPEEAIRIAGALGQSADPPHPVLLDTLAAALAAAGRFDEAVQVASRAVSLARAGPDEGLAAPIESRLALYRSGRPYVESPR